MPTTSRAGAAPGHRMRSGDGPRPGDRTPLADPPAGATSGAPPAGTLRRLPVPVSQPPFDDEVGVVAPTGTVRRRTRRRHQGQGTLALAVVTPAGPAEPSPSPVDDLSAGLTAAQGARARPTRPVLPDPRRWTATLAQAALEGIHGRRSIQQLVRWTDETVYRAIARRAAEQTTTPAVRPRVRTIRACRVDDTVAEVCVVVQLGTRVRAVAVRLEAVDDRWLCTAFDLVEPSRSRRPQPGARDYDPENAASNADA